MPTPLKPHERLLSAAVDRTAWIHAKHNAMLSGLPFKDYLTYLLKESKPIPQQKSEPRAAAH